MDVSMPTLWKSLSQDSPSSQESSPSTFTDLDDLEDLEYEQEEAMQDLNIKLAKQNERAKEDANTFGKIHENHVKEMRELKQRHCKD